jgi:hypothetical protein
MKKATCRQRRERVTAKQRKLAPTRDIGPVPSVGKVRRRSPAKGKKGARG